MIGTALYAGAKGLKGLGKRGKKVFPETENINIGVGGPQIEDSPFIKRKRKWDLGGIDPGPSLAAKGGRIGAKGGGIAKRGNGAAYKSGGRTGKQFGGGLNRPVARPIGGVGAPVRPLAYKHGGKVKSMGVAKRGGGIAKR